MQEAGREGTDAILEQDADLNTVLHVAAANDLVDIATIYLEHYSYVLGPMPVYSSS